MFKIFLIYILVLICFLHYKESKADFIPVRYVYDYKTGNSYNVQENSNSTTINGYNSQNGSSWNLRQDSNGTYSGTDAQGNNFNGDSRTGRYYNYGTGESCYGIGNSRRCY